MRADAQAKTNSVFPVEEGRAPKAAGADDPRHSARPSATSASSTYFFSPSNSKNDSKAGGAFILAPQPPAKSQLQLLQLPNCFRVSQRCQTREDRFIAPYRTGGSHADERTRGRSRRLVALRVLEGPFVGSPVGALWPMLREVRATLCILRDILIRGKRQP